MASSPDIDGQIPPKQGLEGEESSRTGGEQQDILHRSGKVPLTNGDGRKAASGRQQESTEDANAGALSNKEKKEKAKAEKAARRAKEKQGQQGQPVVDLSTNTQPESKARRSSTANAAPPIPKGQHKRTGSVTASSQKLPVRPAQIQAIPIISDPPKENKNVALFDHLYGPSRRNTLAGASKDVHPAVLALGLQMRNYVICGSSARCVATLLAFKRVRILFLDLSRRLLIYITGHRGVQYPVANFLTSSSHYTSVVSD